MKRRLLGALTIGVLLLSTVPGVAFGGRCADEIENFELAEKLEGRACGRDDGEGTPLCGAARAALGAAAIELIFCLRMM